MQTITAIKADIGSIGGHTEPSTEMLEVAREGLAKAKKKGLITGLDVTHTGDDICLLMVHKEGSDAPEIHELAWSIFLEATEVDKSQGLYGAGQDLLKDAPSGNVRGAGPGAAEITFDTAADERPAEPFLIFTADKCGPGIWHPRKRRYQLLRRDNGGSDCVCGRLTTLATYSRPRKVRREPGALGGGAGCLGEGTGLRRSWAGRLAIPGSPVSKTGSSWTISTKR